MAPTLYSLLLLAAAAISTSNAACQIDQECLNGGGCEILDNGLVGTCDCTSSYTGEKCDIECPILCYNGAECRTDVDEHVDLGLGADADFYCECADGWFGSLCDIPVTTCPNGLLKCFNGGSCLVDHASTSTTSTSTYVCDCPDTHTGLTCMQLDTTPPAPTPVPTLATPTPCSVCGEGLVVTKLEAVFSFPDQPAVACLQLQDAGTTGKIAANECPFLPTLIVDICGCLPISSPTPVAISPPSRLPTPSPAVQQPSSSSSLGSQGGKTGLSTGAIAGVVATAIVGITLVMLTIVITNKNRKESSAGAEQTTSTMQSLSGRDLA